MKRWCKSQQQISQRRARYSDVLKRSCKARWAPHRCKVYLPNHKSIDVMLAILTDEDKKVNRLTLMMRRMLILEIANIRHDENTKEEASMKRRYRHNKDHK